jgi:hypothetical protein
MSFFEDFIPHYSAIPAQMYALYVLAGVFGALVRVAWLDKPIKWIHRDQKGGWKLGFFGEVLVGAAVAVIIDGHPIRAGLGAVFAPTILSTLQDTIVESLSRGRRRR